MKARDGSVERRAGDQDQIQFDEDEFSVDPNSFEQDQYDRWRKQSRRSNERTAQRNVGKKSRRNPALIPQVDRNVAFKQGLF